MDAKNGEEKRSGARGLRRLKFFELLPAIVLLTAAGARAQAPASPSAASDSKNTASVQTHTAAPTQREHYFWDKENGWLFAGIGAARTLDYFSTLNMRRRGRQEILLTNDLVDNHAAFAAVEAAGTGASIGASYLFHRYGHHKLERWTSFLHIGLATTGAARNYCLKTAHKKTVP